MFSTLSDYFFGTVPSSAPVEEEEGLNDECQDHPAGDDWVVVKDEEKSFLLSTEVVTRSRVNLQEDLSRENFLIEYPLSLSSEEIQMRGIKIGRRKKRKVKRTSSGDAENKVRISLRNYQTLIPGLTNTEDQNNLGKNARVLTLTKNNSRGQGASGQDKRRENYHYKRYSGCNNDRKCGQQRSS